MVGLFEFAYCPQFDAKLDLLADIAAPEPWALPGDTGLPILWNFVHHTFKRIAEDCDEAGMPSKVCLSDDGLRACFNTGLYTLNFEPIYCLFEQNRIPGRQPWFLRGFFRESDARLASFAKLPERATYFREISDLVFDYRMDIRINRDHILTDPENLQRLPEILRNPTAFDGAVSIAKKKVAGNYRLAIPQYHDGSVQLLIPIGYDSSKADAALVISREKLFYTGHTCLTLRMAYNNARLIAKPETDWLRPGEDVSQET